MQRGTKEVLTRKFIKDELLFYNKADIKTNLLYIVLFTFVGGAVSMLFFILGPSFDDNAMNILTILIMLVVGGFDTVCVLFIIISFKQRKILENDGFDVFSDKVLYKRQEYRKNGRHYEVYRLLHFEHYEDIRVDSTTYDLASNGDMFYIVVCRYKNPIPRLFYSSRSYVYKEK